VWRRLLYLVCTVEAALLSAALYVLVTDSSATLSPVLRQLCAVAALALAGGCCYAVSRLVRTAVSGTRWLHR
jgi:hypothetical protein